MVLKNKNRLINRLLFNKKFFALIGLVIIILISIPLAKNVSQRYKINQEIKNLQKEIADLQSKNVDLKNFVSYLGSDQFVEEQARLKLGLKKPGEQAAVIKNEASIDVANKNKISTTTTIFSIPGLKNIQTAKTIKNFNRWLEYFFK